MIDRSVQVAAALARRFEGLYLTPYLCPAGVPTIGYGATYYEDGTRVTLHDPKITRARAEALLLAAKGEASQSATAGLQGSMTFTLEVPALAAQPMFAGTQAVSAGRASGEVRAALGPVNLAAIDEYQQQGERKRYLDAQNADLVEAQRAVDRVLAHGHALNGKDRELGLLVVVTRMVAIGAFERHLAGVDHPFEHDLRRGRHLQRGTKIGRAHV